MFGRGNNRTFFVCQHVRHGRQRRDVHFGDGVQHGGQLGRPDRRLGGHSRTERQATLHHTQKQGQRLPSSLAFGAITSSLIFPYPPDSRSTSGAFESTLRCCSSSTARSKTSEVRFPSPSATRRRANETKGLKDVAVYFSAFSTSPKFVPVLVFFFSVHTCRPALFIFMISLKVYHYGVQRRYFIIM